MPRHLIIPLIVIILVLVGAYFFARPAEAPTSPTPAASGKLDINAVCQGALAYMTFPDAAASDAFVAECKEGKHPEVIEQYKKQMGLDEKAI